MLVDFILYDEDAEGFAGERQLVSAQAVETARETTRGTAPVLEVFTESGKRLVLLDPERDGCHRLQVAVWVAMGGEVGEEAEVPGG